MATQFSAVTGGRRRRIPYIERINAQTPQLAQMIQAQKANQRADREFAFREDMAEDAREKEKLAMMLGVGNIGLQGYMGYKKNQAIEKLLTPEVTKEVATPALSPVGYGGPGGEPGVGGISTPTGEGATPGLFSKVGESLTSGSPWLGGLAGTIGSKALVKGDNKFKKAAVGAGIGGATSWVASGGLQKLLTGGGFGGGDPYDTVLGSIFGGAGGLFI